jgi:ribose transport system ATP-binding protein
MTPDTEPPSAAPHAAAVCHGLGSPLLALQGIAKRFDGVVALEDIDFQLAAGEVVALIGENGAGKSTLMKIIGGIYSPTDGRILIDGRERVLHGTLDARRAGIALIHQELNVLDNIDVAGNVYLGREPLCGGPLRLVDRRRMAADTQPYLDQLGLHVSPQTPLSRLSTAERQMVEIAKALSQEARLVIMDEPTSSLTLAETGRLMGLVRELRSQGVAVIYISHRLAEVKAVADRVVVLRDGRNAGELVGEEIVHDAMVLMMAGVASAARPSSAMPAAASAAGPSPAMPAGGNIEPVLSARGRAVAGPGPEPAVFSVRGLRTRRYPLCDVSLEVRAGEILGMAGLVGSGRTEIAEAIFGISRSLVGDMRLGEQPLSIASPSQAIARGVFLIPEDRRRHGLIVDMTVRENVSLPALSKYSRGGLIRRAEEDQAARRAIDTFGIKTPSAGFLARNLSGGNQQKVVLAKWLSMEPRFIIFDEPTRGIDVRSKAEIYGLMRELASRGVGVLMISSDMEEVLSLSDRVVVMHEGRLTGTLEIGDITEDAVMRLAFGGVEGHLEPIPAGGQEAAHV